MVTRVLNEEKNQNYDSYNRNLRYAKFLSLNLEKWMFVACDNDGNVLEEPNKYTSNLVINDEWEQAKSRVIFEGFKQYSNNAFTNGEISVLFTKSGGISLYRNYENHVENIGNVSTIEDLIPYNLTITEQAVKTYGL